jgi:putative effector of murein hydrolase LrgA (UPF0299 family)
MNSNEKPRLNVSGTLFASGLGLLLGGLTLTIQRLSAISDNRLIGTAQETLVILLLPGMIGAMVLSGNVHAFILWVAAAINGVIYFGIGWMSSALVSRYKRRRRVVAKFGLSKLRDSESQSDVIH